MLPDTRTEVLPEVPDEPKLEPLTLQHFVAWLEKQPADVTYFWPDGSDCLACRYIADVTGLSKRKVNHTYSYASVFGGARPYYFITEGSKVNCPGSGVSDWTYGQALARAKQWMVENP